MSIPSRSRLVLELRRWLLPGGAILLAARIWTELDPDSRIFRDLAAGYDYALLALIAVLSWGLRRSRVVGAVVGLALLRTAAAMSANDAWPGLEGPSDPAVRAAMVAVMVGAAAPIAWLGLATRLDRPLLSRRGLTSPLLVITSFAIAVGASYRWPAESMLLLQRPVPLPLSLPFGWDTVPLDLLLGLAVGAGLFAIAAKRGGPVGRALFWSYVALWSAGAAGVTQPDGTVLLLASGLILGAGVAEGSFVLAFHDELTGLPGRRALKHALEGLGRRYTLAMVDVDHFKKFNDRHGHDTGDEVLRMVASRLREVSGGGRAFRYGGEEFTLVFPGASAEEARPHLDALRLRIERSRFVVRGRGRFRKGRRARGSGGGTKKKSKKKKKKKSKKKTLSVAVSIGCAEPDGPGEAPSAVLERADKALYRAKSKGRNRVEA